MISVKLAKTETELVQEKLHETQAIHQLEDKYTKLQQQSSNHIKELDTKLEITTKKYEGKVTQLNAAKKSAEEQDKEANNKIKTLETKASEGLKQLEKMQKEYDSS